MNESLPHGYIAKMELHARDRVRPALICAGLCLCLSIYSHLISFGTGDAEVAISNAGRLLDGGSLYRDVFTSQPPLIFWMYEPLVWLARLLRIPIAAIAVPAGLLLAALSIAVCDRVLLRHPCFAHDARRRLMHAVVLAGIFIIATDPIVFFDREHIFELLVLPYLLRFLPEVTQVPLPRRLSVLIACMAGIGFCIKPHCLIVLAFVQLLIVVRERRLSVLMTLENLIVAAFIAGYAALVLLVTPDYATIVLPMALATYWAMGDHANGMVYAEIALVLLGIAFAFFQRRATSAYRRDIGYILGLCGAFLLYGLINNGWGYTYTPLINFCLLLTFWVGMEYQELLAQDAQNKSLLSGARVCGLSLVFFIGFSLASYISMATSGCSQLLKCEHWSGDLKAALGPSHSFGAISTDFGVWASLSDATGAHWETRFNDLWMLPKFFISGPDFTHSHQWIPAYVAHALASDMDSRKPEVMFVDNSELLYHIPLYVDLVGYLSAYPDFKDAWSHYHHIRSVATCAHPEKKHCSFEVYRRLP